MSKTGLFFGPKKGAVHRVASKIQEAVGADKIELVAVSEASIADLQKFDKIIFGISTVGKETWDSEYANNDWNKFLPTVKEADYSGKTIAIYGLGDHITYAGQFVNSMGMLAKELLKKDATIVGQVSTEGYEFDESEAVIDGKFIGLPIDEDFEPELTDERIAAWISALKPAFGF